MTRFEIQLRVHRMRHVTTATWDVRSQTQWWHGSAGLRRMPIPRKQGQYEIATEPATSTPEVELGYQNGTLFIDTATIELDSVIDAIYLAQRATRAWVELLKGAEQMELT